jgi:hypothetical protein
VAAVSRPRAVRSVLPLSLPWLTLAAATLPVGASIDPHRFLVFVGTGLAALVFVFVLVAVIAGSRRG